MEVRASINKHTNTLLPYNRQWQGPDIYFMLVSHHIQLTLRVML